MTARIAKVTIGGTPRVIDLLKPPSPYTGYLPGRLTTSDSMWNAQSVSSTASTTGRMGRHTRRARGPITGIQVSWVGIVNALNTGQVAIGSPLTLKASLEYPLGTTPRPLYFGGSRTATLSPLGHLSTDLLKVSIADGDLYAIRVWALSDSSNIIPTGINSGGPGIPATPPTSDGSRNDDSVDATTGMNVGTYSTLAPIVTATIPPQSSPGRSLFNLGDSISNGTGDTASSSWSARAADRLNLPLLRYTLSGQTASSYAIDGLLWPEVLPGITDALILLGHNDMGSGAQATIQANLVTNWTKAAAKGCRVWGATILPRTTSTDSFATLANQTIVSGHTTKRNTINDWIRDGAPIDGSGNVLATGAAGLRAGQAGHPMYGWFEMADAVESSRNSGLWKVDGNANTWTVDGTHPSPLGHDAMQALVVLDPPAVVVADPGGSGDPYIDPPDTAATVTDSANAGFDPRFYDYTQSQPRLTPTETTVGPLALYQTTLNTPSPTYALAGRLGGLTRVRVNPPQVFDTTKRSKATDSASAVNIEGWPVTVSDSYLLSGVKGSSGSTGTTVSTFDHCLISNTHTVAPGQGVMYQLAADLVDSTVVAFSDGLWMFEDTRAIVQNRWAANDYTDPFGAKIIRCWLRQSSTSYGIGTYGPNHINAGPALTDYPYYADAAAGPGTLGPPITAAQIAGSTAASLTVGVTAHVGDFIAPPPGTSAAGAGVNGGRYQVIGSTGTNRSKTATVTLGTDYSRIATINPDGSKTVTQEGWPQSTTTLRPFISGTAIMVFLGGSNHSDAAQSGSSNGHGLWYRTRIQGFGNAASIIEQATAPPVPFATGATTAQKYAHMYREDLQPTSYLGEFRECEFILDTNRSRVGYIQGETADPGRTLKDAVLNSTTTVTSATGAFHSGDVGKGVTGTGVPAGAKITAVNSATSITLSAATTTSGSAQTIVLVSVSPQPGWGWKSPPNWVSYINCWMGNADGTPVTPGKKMYYDAKGLSALMVASEAIRFAGVLAQLDSTGISMMTAANGGTMPTGAQVAAESGLVPYATNGLRATLIKAEVQGHIIQPTSGAYGTVDRRGQAPFAARKAAGVPDQYLDARKWIVWQNIKDRVMGAALHPDLPLSTVKGRPWLASDGSDNGYYTGPLS